MTFLPLLNLLIYFIIFKLQFYALGLVQVLLLKLQLIYFFFSPFLLFYIAHLCHAMWIVHVTPKQKEKKNLNFCDSCTINKIRILNVQSLYYNHLYGVYIYVCMYVCMYVFYQHIFYKIDFNINFMETRSFGHIWGCFIKFVSKNCVQNRETKIFFKIFF